MATSKDTLLKENEELFIKQRIRKLVLDDFARGIYYTNYTEIYVALGSMWTKEKVRKACQSMPFFDARVLDTKAKRYKKALALGTYQPSAVDLVIDTEREIIRATVASLLLAHALEVFPDGTMVHIRCESGGGAIIGHWIDLLVHKNTLNTIHDNNSIVIFCSSEDSARALASELVGYVPSTP